MKRIIISGGGTGGHIFPAISIANALKAIDSSIEILFVGAEGRMEMEKVPAAGYTIKGLPIAGLQRSLSLKNLLLPAKIYRCLNKAGEIIKTFKPDVVVGVGGYASAPVLWKAQNMGIPTLVQEQNSYAGLTNKLLGKRAKAVCVAYNGMERFFSSKKIIHTGNPVRQDLFDVANIKEEAINFFSLKTDTPTILALGGSLGALTLNESITNYLYKLEQENIQLIWQTGKSYYNTALKFSSGRQNVKVFDFIYNMNYAFAAADLILSRAGAGTISELCIVGKPAVLIPSPNVSEDHQTKNAMALVKENAAILIKDSDARNNLIPQTIELMRNQLLMKTLGANIFRLALPNAATEIANKILNL